MPIEERHRADIVEIGRRLHDRGFIASNDGNISVRLDADRLQGFFEGVESGRIVEIGNHEDLLRQHGRYRQLHQHQFVRQQTLEV